MNISGIAEGTCNSQNIARVRGEQIAIAATGPLMVIWQFLVDLIDTTPFAMLEGSRKSELRVLAQICD
jgi:hypothetical protein